MPVRKLIWTLQIQAPDGWHLVPGAWTTREEAEAAFQNMMPYLNKRDQAPISHKIVARVG